MGSEMDKMAKGSGMSGVPDPTVPEKKTSTKAFDVAKVVQTTKPPEECYQDTPTAASMYLVWVGAHARAYDKAISTQTWNKAERSLVLTQLIARIEDADVMQRAFAHAVENWPAFTDYAKKNTEWFSPPERPSLILLCKYPAVMVDFWSGHKHGKEIAGSGIPESMSKL